MKRERDHRLRCTVSWYSSSGTFPLKSKRDTKPYFIQIAKGNVYLWYLLSNACQTPSFYLYSMLSLSLSLFLSVSRNKIYALSVFFFSPCVIFFIHFEKSERTKVEKYNFTIWKMLFRLVLKKLNGIKSLVDTWYIWCRVETWWKRQSSFGFNSLSLGSRFNCITFNETWLCYAQVRAKNYTQCDKHFEGRVFLRGRADDVD